MSVCMVARVLVPFERTFNSILGHNLQSINAYQFQTSGQIEFFYYNFEDVTKFLTGKEFEKRDLFLSHIN